MATKPKYKVQDVDVEVVDSNDKIVVERIGADVQERVLKQIETEYQMAWSYNQAKRRVMLARLKLYNNQRRDPDAVGDPLLFSIFNTIHASLYDDKLISTWEGRGGEGDEEVEENLNALAEYDYSIMKKSVVDYFWNWDAEFFGRGLLELGEFSRDKGKMCPIPYLIDPTLFIRDTRASSVNGDIMGNGGMRFGGYEIGHTYWELKDNPAYFNVEFLKKDKEVKSLIDDAREARRQASGLEHFMTKEESLGRRDNYEFRLMKWYTHIKGEKHLVTLGNTRSLIVRFQKLKDQDRWPIIDRTLYPMSNDWDGVTIPDLVEDKQRMRAVLINLALKSAKADVIPSYAFDQTRIKNKNDLNFKSNKFIPVDGRVDNAILPLQKPTVHQYVDGILNILDLAAQKAASTPEIQQGVASKTERTLGELELISAKVDTRYSMSAKIYGWSEAAFWEQWYRLYKKHFKEDIDEKVIRIQGALAPLWRPLARENIIADIDPDVKISSRTVSEAKRMRDKQSFQGFASLAVQEPTANRRAILKKAGKLEGLTKEELDMIFPPTDEELHAEDENAQLNQDIMPVISIMDDHQVHCQIHAKAKQTPKMLAHIRQHKKLMVEKRMRPELFPPPVQQEFQMPGVGGAPTKSVMHSSTPNAYQR